MDRLLLRVPEVADALGVSRSKAYALVAKGHIPSVILGGCKRVPVDALKRRLAESTTPPLGNTVPLGAVAGAPQTHKRHNSEG